MECNPTGAAHAAGVRIGDRLASINGIDVMYATTPFFYLHRPVLAPVCDPPCPPRGCTLPPPRTLLGSRRARSGLFGLAEIPS